MIYHSTGIIKYSIERYVGHKVIIEIDQGIADYYRSLVPKARCIKRQGYPAHVSVVRKNPPASLDAWGKHEGETISFYYENLIDNCPVYHWIHAFSITAEHIREELGLPVYNSEAAPFGFRQRFHITLGNCKG